MENEPASPPPPPPQPPAASAVPPARTWEMFCHLSALSGYIIPFGSIVGPLVLWQIKKQEFPSVEAHGKAALNFQISCAIYAIVSFLLCFVVIGIPLLIAVGIFDLVCVIMASIKANNGESWKYPLSIPFIK